MSLLARWAEPRKKCNVCLRQLPLTSFWKGRKNLYGRRSICKVCQTELSREHRNSIEVRTRNKELCKIWYKEPKNRESIRERQRVDWLYNRAACLVRDARARAAHKKVPFALGEQETEKLQKIINAGVCELSGVLFDMQNARTAYSPTLDRIVPALGYVESNVRVVCNALNLGMNSWGEDTLWDIFQVWAKKRESK